MSSLAKAAAISAAVFLVIILAAVFFISRSGRRPPEVADRTEVHKEGQESPRPEAAAPRGKEFTAPLSREAVKVTIEVLEKGRKRKLPGSRAMVHRATDGDRPGDKVKEVTGSGSFEVELEPGAYIARVQCPRYTGKKRTFTVIKDTPQTLVFELERGNSICGRVLAQGGVPIAGARVLALKELAPAGASLEELLLGMIDIQARTGETAFAAEDSTTEDGSYCLEGLEVFAYTVRAVAEGYIPSELGDVPAPRAEVDVTLQKGGVVGGTVRDTSGNPVDEAVVKAYQELETQSVFKIIMAKARPPIDSVKSNSGGQFQLKTLGPGLYNFLIEARGYQRGEQTKVRITPGQTQNLAFTLKAGLSLKGIVTGPGGEPVSGARIRLTLSGMGAAPRKDQVNISFDEDKITTDDQGEFVADTLEEGSYMLICWHQDYQTLRKNDVRVGHTSDDLQLKLTHGGRIRGHVTDASSGKPLAGARLSATDVADLHKDAVTQEDGTFILAGLQTGGRPVSVNVTAEGFARLRREVRTEEGREVEESFDLEPTGLVAGRVVNSAGDGIPGARVMAKKGAQSGGVEQTLATDVTDREGAFSLSGIEAGENNWIRVKKSEYLDGSSEAFSIEPKQSVDLAPIVLELGGSLQGTVLGPDGKGMSDCLVLVTHEGETEVQQSGNPSSTTGGRGEFLIQGLPSGAVDLVVKATHYLEKRVPQVEVIEGSVHKDIVIQLEQGNAVSGVVVDGRGQPVVGAEVTAKDYAQGVKELRAVTGGDGRFTVEGIQANDVVELDVAHDSFSTYTSEKIKVGSADLKIVLKEHGSLRGTVITSEGKVVESFSVQAQNPATKDPRKQPKSQTFTPPDGSFEYKGVPGGVYTVYVRAPQYSAATLADVKVEEGESVDLGQIILEVGGKVNGKVVDAVTKRPLEGARVQITQGSSRFLRTDPSNTTGGPLPNPVQVTGADGGFAFVGLKGGALTLRVSLDGYVSRKVDDVNPDVADKSQGLVIEIDQGGEINGTVFDAEGKPKAGMPVYLMSEDASANQTQQSDREGKFRFVGVTSGRFTVKAHKFGTVTGGAEQAENTVELSPGSVQTVDLQLE